MTLYRPPDEVESALIEFACHTCGHALSARVRSRAECSRLRRGRLGRGLIAILAAVLGMWMLVASAPDVPETPWEWIAFGMAVAIGSTCAGVYGVIWTVLALAGKGITIEGEQEPPQIAGALGPEDQFHVDGARFVKHSV